MKELNEMELEILNRVFSQPSYADTNLRKQIPFLRITSREYTGVGCYVNFILGMKGEKYIDKEKLEAQASINSIVKVKHLENGLGFVVDVTQGRINFLELFTYGDEEWNGEYDEFDVVDM